MNLRVLFAVAFAYVFPGLGHFYLGRRKRGLAFSGIIVFLFTVGVFIGGDLYSLKASHGDILKTLASLGSMGSGGLYFFALQFAPYGDIRQPTFEYGSTFTLTAGLMNLMLLLDCYDLATGRKDA
ncbi:MAG TPA: DUF6677 family protein [Thermoanaerobaculia bacterium]|nr:DUF6677 family protein [Thermoanaerobaculia bacterium]